MKSGIKIKLKNKDCLVIDNYMISYEGGGRNWSNDNMLYRKR